MSIRVAGGEPFLEHQGTTLSCNECCTLAMKLSPSGAFARGDGRAVGRESAHA